MMININILHFFSLYKEYKLNKTEAEALPTNFTKI